MTIHHDNDNKPPEATLDDLLTPDEIARRITASSGVNMTGRTVWEKARRIGVSKKIGRSMLISAVDIPALLQEEKKSKWPKSSSEERSTTITTPMPTVNSGSEALALLQKSRRKRKLMLSSRG
jgi:hypothetical protein